ncbi:competence/damage-inducible protein A [Candidatus Bathyarchaeota archaeon]|nr:competence/damage-inducible protein A [Candidatus Bathyarchaeota archaeon]
MKHKGSPRIEIIATGDELIYGRILDTNSNWLAKRLAEIGAELRKITVIGDDYEDLSKALNSALLSDAEMIIFTGGLGPSEDDFTVDAIGKALGINVIIDQNALNKIKEIYARRGLNDSVSISRGSRMARILDGSFPLQNPIGMSVGMKLNYNNKTIFSLPGIPVEVQGIFDTHITPIIEATSTHKLLGRTFYVTMVWKNFFDLYRKLQSDYPEIYIKNAATPPGQDDKRDQVRTIKIDIVVQAATIPEAEIKMNSFISDYKKRILTFGDGNITEFNPKV